MTNTPYDEKHEENSCTKGGFGLEPLFTWHGQNVYLPCGAEGEEDGTGEPDRDPDGDDDANIGEGDSDGDSKGVTRREFDQLRKQLSASDRRREEAEKKLKAQEDAKKDELTKATERAEELTKTVEAQNKELADMRLQNAFLMAKTDITWHDPEDALGIAERGGYLNEVVGEDGKVDTSKLGTKLKELAKAKPHLVKTSDSSNGSTGTTNTKTTAVTGQKVGSKGGNGTTGEATLPTRYDKFLKR